MTAALMGVAVFDGAEDPAAIRIGAGGGREMRLLVGIQISFRGELLLAGGAG